MIDRYYLSLGSNIDPKPHILEASRYLDEIGHVISVSPVYLTQPIGMDCEADPFFNLCVILEADFVREDFKTKLKEIEREVGRERTNRESEDTFAPRTIDIDILFTESSNQYSEECLSCAYVVIPLSDLIDPPPFLPFSSRSQWRESVDRSQIKGRVDYEWPESWREKTFEPFDS